MGIGAVLQGEPFFHGTAWKFKMHHLIAWMMKLSCVNATQHASWVLNCAHVILCQRASADQRRQPTSQPGRID